MVTRQHLTVEQYLALPEEKPYLEYVDGEARPKVAPDFSHMVLVHRLSVLLAEYMSRHGGISGPEGRVRFGEAPDTRFLLPDIAYWAARRPVRGEQAMQPPSLAIEVRSAGQPLGALREKAAYYTANGVPECWVIDAGTETVEVFVSGEPPTVESGSTLVARTLPGLELDLTSFFELPEA